MFIFPPLHIYKAMDDSEKNNFRDVENICEWNDIVADEDSNEIKIEDSVPSTPDTENCTELWYDTGSSVENTTGIFQDLTTGNCTLTGDDVEVHCSGIQSIYLCVLEGEQI